MSSEETGTATAPATTVTSPAAPAPATTVPSPAVPTTSVPVADTRFVAERLLDAVREDIGRADAKAAVLLSGGLAFLAVVWAGEGAVVPPGAALGLVVAGGVLWLVGLLMLIGVVLPRTRIGADVTFLRDLSAGVAPEVLRERLTASGADVVRWMLAEASVLGAVLTAKYRWLRAGVCFLTLGVVLSVIGQVW
ncbi:Pycsar system effector family protein [Streptomyces sp. NPDC091272]|uniref:Pycsar system effector family protein n=1 Tax=Streptomyces sp. NPDC091272 TaxID=3365981 RepID=UPI00381C9DF2